MAELASLPGDLAQFRIGVYALIFDEGRILLAHRRDIDWWNLPGGGMELNETVEEAICREVREETGLEVVVEYLVGVYSKPQKQEVSLSRHRWHAHGNRRVARLSLLRPQCPAAQYAAQTPATRRGCTA